MPFFGSFAIWIDFDRKRKIWLWWVRVQIKIWKYSYNWTDIHQWLNTWLTTSIGDGIWLHAEKFKNPKTKFKNRILIFSTKWEWFEIKSTWIHFQSNLIDLNLHLKKLFGSKTSNCGQVKIRRRHPRLRLWVLGLGRLLS